MALAVCSQILVIDKVATGSLSNIYEQILGSSGAANEHEAATNALIEYMLTQAYYTAVFKETELMPFCNSPSDDTFNGGGKQKLRDIAARLKSAGLTMGVMVDGSNLAQFKRVADYNAGSASYQRIVMVYINPTTVDGSLLSLLGQALDDGVGPTQVDWTGSGGRVAMVLEQDPNAIAVQNMTTTLNVTFNNLNITPDPNDTIGSGFAIQIFYHAFRCLGPLPKYSIIRDAMWSLLVVGSLQSTFQYSAAWAVVSPETPQENVTGVYNASRYYSGYFFEGRSMPASAPLTPPSVVRNKKDALAAFEYIAQDIHTAININAELPILANSGSVLIFENQGGVNIYGDLKEYVHSRINPLNDPQKSSFPYENIQDISTAQYCYTIDNNTDFAPVGVPGGVNPYDNIYFVGVVISSQSLMRQLESLHHGPIVISTVNYVAAGSPDYTDKYSTAAQLVSNSATPLGSVVPGMITPVAIPWGTLTFPPIAAGNFSQYFKIIDDGLPHVGSSRRLWWREGGDGLGVSAGIYTNPNATAPAWANNANRPNVAAFSVSKNGRSITYYRQLDNQPGGTNANYDVAYTNPASWQGFTLDYAPEPFVFTILLAEGIDCYGDTDSKLSAQHISGGTPGFSYQWWLGDPNAGGTILPGETAIELEGQPAGHYYLVVTDSLLATTTADFILTQPDAILITLVSYGDNCSGSNNGFINVDVTGGTPGPGFTYEWSGPGGYSAATKNISGLTASGSYLLTVTDNNGCQKTFSQDIAVTTPPPISIVASGLLGSCPGSTVDISIVGSIGAYDNVVWSNGEEDVTSITVDTPGTYTVAAYIGTCFVTSAPVVIAPPLPLTIDAVVVVNNVCGSGSLNDGQLSPTVTSGCAPYSFAWSYLGAPFSTNQNINNLASGDYTLVVTDSNGDTATITATVGIDVFGLEITTDPILCAAQTSNVDVAPIGGEAPYTFVFTKNGVPVETNQTGTILNQTAGNYHVAVTDNNGCLSEQDFTITAPDPIGIDVTTTNSDYGQNNGTATATPRGGTGAYSYSWNTAPAQTTQTAVDLAPGDYTVTVTDDNGCSAQATVTIVESAQNPDIPGSQAALDLQMIRFSCCFAEIGSKYLCFLQGGQQEEAECLAVALVLAESYLCIICNEDSCVTDTQRATAVQKMSELCECCGCA